MSNASMFDQKPKKVQKKTALDIKKQTMKKVEQEMKLH